MIDDDDLYDEPEWLRKMELEDDEPAWLKNGPEWMRNKPEWMTGSIRSFRLAMNGGSHTESEWLALCDLHGNRCLCCKRKRRKLTKDHVIPVLLGGHDDISNIQPLCQSCNSRKGAHHIDYRPKINNGL